jgi:DNA polymerase-3 subunit delta'
VLAIPRGLTGLGSCFGAAATLIAATDSEADAAFAEVDVKERVELETAMGAGGTGRGAAGVMRGASAALKELERRQKSRATRARRDALDRALVDLAAFYRDVLVLRLDAGVVPVHMDAATDAADAAKRWTAEATLRRLEAVLACRDAVEANVKPQIAVEAMMVALWRG